MIFFNLNSQFSILTKLTHAAPNSNILPSAGSESARLSSVSNEPPSAAATICGRQMVALNNPK